MKDLEDHGLPLVQLKEQRRELVVALAGRNGPISDFEISEIASLQQAIAAMEAVVDDLDFENSVAPAAEEDRSGFWYRWRTALQAHGINFWSPLAVGSRSSP